MSVVNPLAPGSMAVATFAGSNAATSGSAFAAPTADDSIYESVEPGIPAAGTSRGMANMFALSQGAGPAYANGPGSNGDRDCIAVKDPAIRGVLRAALPPSIEADHKEELISVLLHTPYVKVGDGEARISITTLLSKAMKRAPTIPERKGLTEAIISVSNLADELGDLATGIVVLYHAEELLGMPPRTARPLSPLTQENIDSIWQKIDARISNPHSTEDD